MIKELEYSYAFLDGQHEHGRSTWFVHCPFCDSEIEVYIWSFYGCGKKCECGAILHRWKAYKECSET